jgi:hypothetical protein
MRVAAVIAAAFAAFDFKSAIWVTPASLNNEGNVLPSIS